MHLKVSGVSGISGVCSPPYYIISLSLLNCKVIPETPEEWLPINNTTRKDPGNIPEKSRKSYGYVYTLCTFFGDFGARLLGYV